MAPEQMLTPEEKARVLRGETVPVPRITELRLADGRAMRLGETWTYNDGPAHCLLRVEGRPQRGGVKARGEPFPAFVTDPKGDGQLGFDAVLDCDPAKWKRVA